MTSQISFLSVKQGSKNKDVKLTAVYNTHARTHTRARAHTTWTHTPRTPRMHAHTHHNAHKHAHARAQTHARTGTHARTHRTHAGDQMVLMKTKINAVLNN